MIDTGATATAIDGAVVRALGIQPIGATRIVTPASPEPVLCAEHQICLVFPNDAVLDEVTAIEASLDGQGIGCLIGRNVLHHGILIHQGHLNQFTLSF
ncbi:MAG: hypothetical protein K8I02_13780 [Candidatus Methylomirabilis sp.]|nr:hypothetical protein [Deltaproteobacteria bacterium]